MRKLVFTFLIAAVVAILTLSDRNSQEAEASPTTTMEIPEPISFKKEVSHKKEILMAPSQEVSTFQKETASILEKLPTNKVYDDPNQNPDYPPPGLLNSSVELGKVLDSMKANPSLIPTGMGFYKQCAQSSNLLDQVRAVCLRNLLDWAKKTGTSVDSNAFSSDINQLASFLPKARLE